MWPNGASNSKRTSQATAANMEHHNPGTTQSQHVKAAKRSIWVRKVVLVQGERGLGGGGSIGCVSGPLGAAVCRLPAVLLLHLLSEATLPRRTLFEGRSCDVYRHISRGAGEGIRAEPLTPPNYVHLLCIV